MLFFFIGGGVQCKQVLVSGIQEECIVDFNWCYFVSDFIWIVWLFQVVGVEYSGFFQVFYVIGVNLFQWGEVLVFLVMVIGWLVVVGDGGNWCGWCSVGVQGVVDFLWVVKISSGQYVVVDQQGDDQCVNGVSGRYWQMMLDKGQDQLDVKEDEDIVMWC